jgi:hypothetical protein
MGKNRMIGEKLVEAVTQADHENPTEGAAEGSRPARPNDVEASSEMEELDRRSKRIARALGQIPGTSPETVRAKHLILLNATRHRWAPGWVRQARLQKEKDAWFVRQSERADLTASEKLYLIRSCGDELGKMERDLDRAMAPRPGVYSERARRQQERVDSELRRLSRRLQDEGVL